MLAIFQSKIVIVMDLAIFQSKIVIVMDSNKKIFKELHILLGINIIMA